MTASTTRRTTAARSRLAAVGSIAVAGALILTGCGDQTDSSSSESKETGKSSTAPLFDKLPKKIQDAGEIKVGTNAEYAPMEFQEGGKIVGVDPDIAAALGEKLGVDFKFTSGSFDGLITSLNSGRYDIAMSSITDNKQRQEGLDDKGKKLGPGVDFVDYFLAGTAVYVQKGNPKNINSIEDLCGQTAAVQRGTTYEQALKDQSKKCTDAGEKAVKIESFENDTEAQTRVKSGGAVAGVNDYPVAVDLARKADNGNAFEVVGEQIDAGPFGIAVNKDNKELTAALEEAVNAIIEDGTYKKILEKWGAETGAIDKAAINGGK
ncbi:MULTISPECIES: ABC transporter substrate-binding protein [Streptomyces]|uniref:ABC transporter substrate-binding protein n=1 Tax=Streptomyces fuscus TaxID=3048495 RepID=A0ABT7J548_9ACTN|nr:MULTISPECIES: ABC transporter substrate-binding protein [Streptomyces]MCM1973871.1 ABC transporter substrate-binding protein [Streptomyces sp. G1]MDL2079981.1 ABC transporter substrate-binding protein [Streptomyces fuscus]SBT91490.1 amino acid ABC transporter substrate-binding protein, PAAT family [Streptomyces sp. DI166]